MRLDLHLHSTASDGACAPAEVVRRAVKGRLDVIALADHDTVAGVPEAMAEAERLGREGAGAIQIVPAIEVSSTWEGDELHFLGYFVNLSNPALVEHGRRAGNRRMARMEEMLSRLASQDVNIPLAAVLEAAGPDRHSVGRPHLARALVDAGFVKTIPEAFDRYIGNQHQAFVPTMLLNPDGAVALILEAGGVPVWAHPPDHALDALLDSLVEAGLMGLEVFRPKNTARRIAGLEERARKSGLLVSGGSDWHGPDNGVLGDFHVTSREVARLLELGGI